MSQATLAWLLAMIRQFRFAPRQVATRRGANRSTAPGVASSTASPCRHGPRLRMTSALCGPKIVLAREGLTAISTGRSIITAQQVLAIPPRDGSIPDGRTAGRGAPAPARPAFAPFPSSRRFAIGSDPGWTQAPMTTAATCRQTTLHPHRYGYTPLVTAGSRPKAPCLDLARPWRPAPAPRALVHGNSDPAPLRQQSHGGTPPKKGGVGISPIWRGNGGPSACKQGLSGLFCP